MIRKTEVDSVRSYIITEKRPEILTDEYERIENLLREGEKVLGGITNADRK